MTGITIKSHDTGNEPVGQEWDTTQLQEDFTVQAFQAPFVVVVRKSVKTKKPVEA